MIESDVDERVYVERWVGDLPTPEEPPAVGITNDGVFQYRSDEAAWVPFEWASAFHVESDGRVRVGTSATPIESLDSRTVNGVRQVRARAEAGSGTKADPFVVSTDLLEGYHGLLNFGPGWFEVDGLETDAGFSYDERSVYLQGDGVRTTTLLHAADAPDTPTVYLRGDGGNFGGVRDMTVYGAGEGDTGGTANIVETDGGVIDYQFENVIFRWGGGDALRVNTSGSGTRVTNAWLENAGGWAFYLDGGERVKVDNVHTTGTVGGVFTNGTLGTYSNLTLTSLRGGSGVVSTSAGNQFTNVVVKTNANNGFEIRGGGNSVSNVYLSGLNDSAFLVAAPATISNVFARDFGDNAWEPMFDLHADGTTISNAVAAGGDAGRRLFAIRDGVNRCHIDGIAGTADIAWDCVVGQGATENVIDRLGSVAYADVADDGTRTLINRWGTNEGDPSETGEWFGHAGYAGTMGATVWDTTTSPWTPHRATPNGKWQ